MLWKVTSGSASLSSDACSLSFNSKGWFVWQMAQWMVITAFHTLIPVTPAACNCDGLWRQTRHSISDVIRYIWIISSSKDPPFPSLSFSKWQRLPLLLKYIDVIWQNIIVNNAIRSYQSRQGCDGMQGPRLPRQISQTGIENRAWTNNYTHYFSAGCNSPYMT